MPCTSRLFKSFSRLLLPVLILVIAALGAASIWLAKQTATPPRNAYLMSPDKYGQLSSRAAQIVEQQWPNSDGTTARGWLLKGMPGAPAVILFHSYGGDRSYMLNLGVKLNEATDFTILMPDQRGHGENPPVKYTSLGGCETDDAAAAVKFLRGLKYDDQTTLVGQSIGIYGTEMGALVGMLAAAKDDSVKTLVLDSVPAETDSLLTMAVEKRYPFASVVTSRFARAGAAAFFYDGCYRNESMCAVAKTFKNKEVLLLAGGDNSVLQGSTSELMKCFPNTNRVQAKTDLYPSGPNMVNASLEQFAEYDARVIAFFKNSLGEVILPVQ
jgi:pimeloyl-ACP methyl ester carboxylesterase